MQQPESHRTFLLALLPLLALAALLLWLQWPRAVTGADAPADVFSAQRAVNGLTDLFEAAGGGPHPVGTEANRRLHRALTVELEALGWQVELQRGVGCRNMRTCAEVENVVAKRPGQGTGPAVMVACHTDSVPAGPGAGDDGAGMAVMLELARNLAASEPLDRPVWLLFDEGEEMGLLGADLFVRRMEPDSVGAVVNLEARGTQGPVWLFETSDGGGALIDAYARSVARPTTTSIAYSVYKRMPNDTDLTVFRQAGLPGLGLAFIDGGARYHTPRDDLEHLSTATVERMGQSTLGLVRELASAELPLAHSEAVFFDVGSFFTVRWPAALSLLLSLLAVGGVVARASRPDVGPRALGGAAAWLLAAVASLLGGALVYFGLDAAGAFPMAFPASLPFATAAAAAMGTAASFLSGRAMAPTPPARLLGALLGLGLLGLILSALEPAASYPFVLAALFGAAAAWRSISFGAAVTAGTLLVTLVPLVRMLPVGVGPMGLIGSGFLAGLIAAPLIALLPATPRIAPFGIAALLLTVAAGVFPAITDDEPRPLSLRAQVEVDPADGARTSRLLFLTSSPLPDALAKAAGPIELAGTGGYSVPAAALEDPGSRPVEVRVLDRDDGTLKLHLRSPQAAWALWIDAPEGTQIVSVAWPGLEPVRSEEGTPFLRLQAVAAEGVTLELRGSLEGLLTLTDRALGLPPQARPLVDARPSWAVPIGSGDLTDVVSRVELADLYPTSEDADEDADDAGDFDETDGADGAAETAAQLE